MSTAVASETLAGQQAANEAHRAIEIVGNHAAKMVTMLALSTFPDEELVTYDRIAKQLEALCDGQHVEPQHFSSLTILDHCRRSLSEVNFVEVDTVTSSVGRTAEAARLTEKGRSLGLAMAGALLWLELETPQSSFLQKIMGTSPDVGFEPGRPRPAIFNELLKKPTAIVNLRPICGLSAENTADAVRTLRDSGVLEIINLRDPNNRVYRISDREQNLDTFRSEKTKAAVYGALSLRQEGITAATGIEIAQRGAEICPEFGVEEIWHAFRVWMQKTNPSRFVQEARPLKKRHENTEVRIVEEYREPLTKFLEIRELLAGDTSEAVHFRYAARQQAQDLLGSPASIASLLRGDGKGPAPIRYKQEDWAREVEPLIPIKMEGEIEIRELYSQVVSTTGKHVSFDHFRTYLVQNERIEITFHKSATGSKPRSFAALLKTSIFPRNWEEKAACNGEDPELFFPVSTIGPAVTQAEKAKSVCKKCPVAKACLKAALDRGDTFGISGGLWLEKGEFTPELRSFIGSHVIVK